MHTQELNRTQDDMLALPSSC